MDHLADKMKSLQSEIFREAVSLFLVRGKTARWALRNEKKLRLDEKVVVHLKYTKYAAIHEFTLSRFCAFLALRQVIEVNQPECGQKLILPSLAVAIGPSGDPVFDKWVLPLMTPGIQFSVRYLLSRKTLEGIKKTVFGEYSFPKNSFARLLAASVMMDWHAFVVSSRKADRNFTISLRDYAKLEHYSTGRTNYREVLHSFRHCLDGDFTLNACDKIVFDELLQSERTPARQKRRPVPSRF